MKESPPNKKLVLIYLANEITQTSKMRKKEEFLRASSAVRNGLVFACYSDTQKFPNRYSFPKSYSSCLVFVQSV
jgi:hypothetical protein